MILLLLLADAGVVVIVFIDDSSVGWTTLSRGVVGRNSRWSWTVIGVRSVEITVVVVDAAAPRGDRRVDDEAWLASDVVVADKEESWDNNNNWSDMDAAVGVHNGTGESVVAYGEEVSLWLLTLGEG